uniref:Uncharacterized protein n=1 Tax=Candidatus Kentrum sp. TC TaxID=2126339 RepID=A0A450YD05_9GAMM|nr:MAG: hypothetical protein BECKTC1821D_GA0114238_100652 [Candidatus Kentron sp. TC]
MDGKAARGRTVCSDRAVIPVVRSPRRCLGEIAGENWGASERKPHLLSSESPNPHRSPMIISAPIPLKKPPTGEPCAEKPHTRFGGRGGETRPLPLSIGGAPESLVFMVIDKKSLD